uniref:CRISPR-associated nuclease/helicase Cas3 n=1 Tax=Mycobacterium riyadhense TaxID=486698 RepID=A0A653ERV6_9MYCO|nr:CRISPR-associated nuclease/helicase Cas3 [Mycobacterium riyadhense]
MGSFTAHDFAAFVGAVHGHDPFPWQVRLAEQVLTTGKWPTLLDIPTGAGKTVALDIALFSLAADPLAAPRRIVFVVDRRVIVTQVAGRVRQLLGAFGQSQDSDTIVAKVSRRLRALFGSADAHQIPFVFAELRGGIALDDSWASRPDVPTVLVSTVDQVGSRLLFRGYGVSRGMRPIHAGLLGCDALFLLDEVHLSRPFAQTLRELRTYHRPSGPLPDRWQVVEMTATPSGSGGDVFGLTDYDLAEDSSLAPRLNSTKQASLQLLGSKAQDSNDALVQHVPRLATGIPGQVVGIMVNRVATAVAIADALEQIDQPDRVILLTGRMRPLDRDDIWEGVQAKVGAGRTRSNGPRLYVVATQTIEAGADLDFDALITEVAPVDSLRQRFGRVDRFGRLSSAGTPAQIIIVAGHKQTAEKFDDPVYGKALSATWRELERRYPDISFDVGPLSTSLPAGPEFLSPALDSPLLLDSHLDMLVQTDPAPAADLDITPWLHGPQSAPADVNVVWRADIDDRLLEIVRAAGDEGDGRDLIIELLLACPPKASEAIALPIWSVKSWLSSGDTGPDLADVDQQEPPTTLGAARDRLMVRWAGADTDLVTVQDIRPGDTLVVPAARGGLRRSNWDPGYTRAVPDLGDRAHAAAGVAPVLRLHTGVIARHVGSPEILPMPPLPVDPDIDVYDNSATDIAAWLAAIRSAGPTPWLADICQSLSSITGQQVVVAAGEAGGAPTKMYVLRGKRPARDLSWREAGLEFDGGDLTNSFIGHAVPLEAHCNGVGELASQFAAACGVPDHLRQDLGLAGRLHDLGKADPRFQTWLCDGDEIAMIRAGTLLAKSADSHRDKRQRDLARRRAGYPVGMGHSLLSVALTLSSPQVLDTAHDRELVLHLIASHHGHCRALPPPQPDPAPVDVELTWDGHRLHSSSDHGLSQLDSGVTERFWRLNKRYGRHGLAWLETLLRLADHRRSGLEQLRQEGGGR